MGLTVWTVGHSTRTADEFAEVLSAHAVERIADVRRFPASRRHPHFSREQLAPVLASRGIDYRWLPELGGRRTPRHGSVNTSWRVAGFRGYADYMETPEFGAALSALVDLARERRTAIMCAESLWWQCHRRLIADALVARGHIVVHVLAMDDASPHKLLSPASLRGGRLTYAEEQADLGLDD